MPHTIFSGTAASAMAIMASAAKIDRAQRRRDLQCEMLDCAHVPNNRNAIRDHMAKVWTGEAKAQHGRHDLPATIRRQRAKRVRETDNLLDVLLAPGEDRLSHCSIMRPTVAVKIDPVTRLIASFAVRAKADPRLARATP